MALPFLATTGPAHALRAQLFQRATALATPVGAHIEVEPVPRAGTLPPRLPVTLPRVRQPQDFELRVEVRDAASRWRPAGRIPLRVYPEDLLEPLRRFAERHELRVVEDDGRLETFLDAHRVPFTARGAAPRPAKGAAITLYAGRPAERAALGAPASRGAAVLFREREHGLPHLVVEGAGEQARVAVEMPLLSRLADDPGAQQTFVGIFELLEARHERGDLP